MEQEQLTEFKIQLALPAPNIEIAQEVANKAQVLINQFGYYQFLNLVDFMQKNPGAVSNQRQNAVNILNNRERYEAIVSECDKILGSINYKEPSKPAPEFEEFKAYMGNVDVRLNRSEALLKKIAEELGLFKDK